MARARFSLRWTTTTVVAVGVILGGLIGTSLGWALFSSSSTAQVTTTVSSGSLNAPTGVTAIATNTTVAVSWSGVTDPGSGTFGYFVTRTPYPSGTSSNVCSSSPTSLLSGSTCSDTAVPPGTYTYTVSAVYDAWTATSAASSTVTITIPPSVTPPVVAATVIYGTNPTWVDGVNVTLTDSPTANGSPVASVSYYYCPIADGSCNNSDWTFINSSSTGPHWTASWSSLPADGTYNVVATATNTNSNTSNPSSPTAVGIDTHAPTVSTPTVNGFS
jgi:hypothetical protein